MKCDKRKEEGERGKKNQEKRKGTRVPECPGPVSCNKHSSARLTEGKVGEKKKRRRKGMKKAN